MKKMFMAVLAILAIIASMDARALPQNLPHHNDSDVDDTLRIFIPYSEFGLAVSTQNELRSITSSGAIVSYITTSTTAALQMTNTNQNIPLFITLPDNLCVDCQVKFGVVWSAETTSTGDSATWKILYGRAADGSAIATASTALSTAITVDTKDDSAYGYQESPLGVINASTFSRGDGLTLLVSLGATGGALNPINKQILFHGINLYYVREKI